MKIIAQAQVPTTPSFIHIAYTAAVQAGNQATSVALTLIGGVIVLYVIQRKRLLWKLGAIVLTLAVAVCLYTVMPAPYAYPGEITGVWQQDIYYAVLELQEKHQPVPGTVQKLADRSGRSFEHTKDAWGRSFRITSYKGASGTQYSVLSAGRDGRFGTQDDILFPRPDDRRR